MGENLHLVTDLALILISAGLMTIVFKLLRQPLVLGYIVAGFIVGPHFDLFPTVIEQANVQEWSEIGIIFLLFALGLEFSFKKLFQVGSTAFISAALEIIFMGCIGVLVGMLMDWTTMESIFLGGMLAMSSTTIIIKAFDDLSLKKQKFADITMVILIIQDIVAIVMMVLLSTAAASQKFAGMEMIYCILKLLFFMILWFTVGISVVPTFFRKTKQYINDETLLIISIGLCFGMVVFANYVGFSSALGAFVMGSILAETVEVENIERLTKSIKDMFGAIFFVSVGMMVNPDVLIDYWDTFLILTLIVLVIKSIVSSGAVLITGQPLRMSLQVGLSLAQIGEFAFIIAALGVSLGVLSDFIYPVIVAVSVVTTFTTPYCIKFANPLCNWIYRQMPENLKNKLSNYRVTDSSTKLDSEWVRVFKKSFIRTAVFSVLCFSTIWLSYRYLSPLLISQLKDSLSLKLINILVGLITITAVSPFLYGLMRDSHLVQNVYSRLWRESKFSRTFIVAWSIARICIGAFFVITIISKSFKFTSLLVVVVAVAIAVFIYFSRTSLKRYTKFEDNFINNLNAKEVVGEENNKNI